MRSRACAEEDERCQISTCAGADQRDEKEISSHSQRKEQGHIDGSNWSPGGAGIVSRDGGGSLIAFAPIWIVYFERRLRSTRGTLLAQSPSHSTRTDDHRDVDTDNCRAAACARGRAASGVDRRSSWVELCCTGCR